MKLKIPRFYITTAFSLITVFSHAKPIVLMVGDSHVSMLGPRIESKTRGDWIFRYEGINGAFVRDWSRWIESSLKRHHPNYLMIVLGTNDSTLKEPSIEFVESEKLINIGKKFQCKIVWVGPPDISKRFPSASKIKTDLVPQNVSYLDSFEKKIEISKDGVHPTRDGYTSWSDYILTRFYVRD